eukprot:SM004706S16668  [mRNA]  locus=s4706:956:1057:+ [translate_table: standard]
MYKHKEVQIAILVPGTRSSLKQGSNIKQDIGYQ